MKPIIAKIRKLLNSDKGASTLFPSLLFIMVIVFATGLGADMIKNAYVNDAYNTAAQESTDIAIKSVDSSGSLNFIDTVPIVVEEYEKARDRSSASNTRQGYCVSDGFKQNSQGKNFVGSDYPYYEVTLRPTRSDTDNGLAVKSQYFTADNIPSNAELAALDNQKASGVPYRVVDVKIHDVTMNFFAGMLSNPHDTSSANLKCQTYTIEKSAIVFGSQSDI